MERNEKESGSLIFDIAFTLTHKCEPYTYLNVVLIVLQFALFLLKIYDIIVPSIQQQYSIPYNSVFTIISIILAIFIVFTFFSYYFQCFPTVWFYFLLLLQAIQMVYVQLTVRCFVGVGWCQADSKSILLTVLAIVVYSLVIWLRLHCYNPFYDSVNAIAMKSGKTILYSFIYSWLLSLTTNQLIISTTTGEKQILFFITVSYYSFIYIPPNFSPVISRTTILCANALLWTSGVAWLMPLIQQLLGGNPISFWFYWGYSVPIVLLLSFLHSSKLADSYDWKVLFFQKKVEDLTNLFLQVNELTKEIAVIKKSDLGTNSPQFRRLWKIIAAHNEKCVQVQCPLASLMSLKIIREDELLQEKRFNRTVQKTLQFGLYCLSSQREVYPNLIALSLQIANFELEVFRLRTKGLQLFNKDWNRAESEEKWAIYYLKKRIESFEGSGEASSGERQQVIASFKHQIQKSVGMLAEFWYFLSDPKCNLKKLYDIANVLFPQKRSVDEAWKSVRGLKNVDCHSLYAKYLIRMFNDKQQGLKVLEQGKRLQIEAHQKEQVSAGEVPSEEHGVIFLEFDGKNSGIMYQVNSACQKIFGYNKGELQGRKVNDIMPKFFALHHDRILEHYQQTNRPRMMNKERSVWGRGKDGYCFPFLICIKPVRNYFSQTNEVYASVKRDLWVKEKCFFFVDNDLNITDISASLLTIYPQFAGRVYLKKRIHLSEIIAEYQIILRRLIELQQTYDLTVTRTFNLTSRETFSETVTFVVQAEEITTAAAGKIGYYFRMAKGTASSNYDPSSNQVSLSRQKTSGYSGHGKEFKLMVALRQGEKAKKVVFQGGIVKDMKMLKSQVISKISETLQKQKLVAKQGEVSRLTTDWAGQIKTKRLQGTAIRQIHDMSEQSEQNGAVGNQKSQDQLEASEMIKPCELNAILQRQKANKPILLLKVLAIAILVVSTLLYIFEYLSLHSFKNQTIDLLKTYSQLNSLQAQTMYINNFANRLVVNGTTQAEFQMFSKEVFDLDSLTNAVPFSISSQLAYSDGTSQSMLLSFAINKLVSEADILANSELSSSSLYFIQYNSVNGLQVGCEQGLQFSWNAIALFYTQGVIFLTVCGSLLAVTFIIQNLVLRQVLNKKADILNIFFQIPRYTCTFLQKECERFIQKLTNNEEDDQAQLQTFSEQGEQSSKKNKTQKKRTIMGQEKTGSDFLVISVLMMGYFMIYPVLIQGMEQKQNAGSSFAFKSFREIVSMQKQLAKAMSFMNTHLVSNSFPLSMNQDSMSVINSQYTMVINLLVNISSDFFYLGDTLDLQYLSQFNQLFYSNLCASSPSCNDKLGQSKGLNVILLNYIDYLVSKYNQIKATTTYNLTLLYPYQVQSTQQSYRLLIKKYWRQLEVLLINGLQRYLLMQDSALFGAMVGFSVLNLSVLLWIWLRFYNQLQKKIKATEYILTFIPLDEINKNPKIVQYIKEKILKIK